MGAERPRSLVVGGGGFVGRQLVEALLRRGEAVRVFDLAPHDDPRVESIVGDLRDPAAALRACTGVETVFQTASLVDWRPGSERALHAVNVAGNRHIIDACVATGVKKLVYTSSIDTVFGGRPIRDGDEGLPYPRRHLDTYGRTKMLGELDVLHANGRGGLATCSLRLAGVYGPGDRHRFPPILALARANRGIRLGDGRARFNHVYVGNVVHAHLLAAERLAPGSPVAGACYFITDAPPTNFFDFFEPFLQALGLPAPTRSIPYRIAYPLAVATELGARLRIGRASQAPSLTRYIVASTCVDFYFSRAKARRDLGYEPVVGELEARAQTLGWLRTFT